MEQRQWASTGHTVRVDDVQFDRIPDFDPRSGDHLWTWAVAYRANPGTETPMLDMENLLLITGPGCYYCEKVYSPQLAQRRCKGEPR